MADNGMLALISRGIQWQSREEYHESLSQCKGFLQVCPRPKDMQEMLWQHADKSMQEKKESLPGMDASVAR